MILKKNQKAFLQAFDFNPLPQKSVSDRTPTGHNRRRHLFNTPKRNVRTNWVNECMFESIEHSKLQHSSSLPASPFHAKLVNPL
ncbi:hypothetical protein CEXT_303241 [Caerostris extrusa]|uniref:Ycf1 n=1 Tax=Caerostris extrusa TaxID=172846 RepID=A0AAV4WEP1_CAEEX|nr:hypothetical protein CEXT_303241 [Caerostris extrusa]